jgi:hypothetical protein
MYGLCRRDLLNRLERGTGQRSAGSVLEAGAEVKVARVPETNDRVSADRILSNLQVLQCGTVQAGDTWHLKSRPNAWLNRAGS